MPLLITVFHNAVIAAVKMRAPGAEEIRLARIADEPSVGGAHVSGWLTLLAYVVLAIPAAYFAVGLYRMFSD